MTSATNSEMGQLSSKIAIVTGGSSGIGFAIAQRLVESGAHVTICGRNADALTRARRALGPSVDAIDADVTDPSGVTGLIEDVVEHHGGIDLLINNAGT